MQAKGFDFGGANKKRTFDQAFKPAELINRFKSKEE